MTDFTIGQCVVIAIFGASIFWAGCYFKGKMNYWEGRKDEAEKKMEDDGL